MPNSYTTFTGNGSTTNFNLTAIDGWVSTAFLKVYIDGVLQTTGYSFIDLTTATPKVSFTTAPASGKAILVSRETPATVSAFQNNIVNFNNGSVLTEEDLDNLTKGLLHVSQEAKDVGTGALGLGTDGNWTAGGKIIKNLGDPVVNTDAATKQYVDAATLYGTGAATPQAWEFTGDGSTLAFSWTANSQPAPLTVEKNMFLVEVGGILQPPTKYTTSLTYLTFNAGNAPASGVNISVRNLGTTRNVMAFNDPVTFNSSITAASATIDNIPINNGATNNANTVIIGTGGANMTDGGSESVRNTTAIGKGALNSLTTGVGNTAIGKDSLNSLTTYDMNTAIGVLSGSLLTGSANTIAGYAALSPTSSMSSNNVCLGWYAGYYYGTGSWPASGSTLTSLQNSILIGYDARPSANNPSNEIVIGYQGRGSGTNTTTIGNSNTSKTKLFGNLEVTGTGTTSFAGNVQSAVSPSNASDLCRKDYVDSLNRIGACVLVRTNASVAISDQTLANTFSILNVSGVGYQFRTASGTWKGSRIDTAVLGSSDETFRTVTTSSDTGPIVSASAIYCFTRTA